MIEFKCVSKQYSPDAVALREVSLTVNKGELVYLAGPSGAGKSTLLKMIAAMERPTSGNVLVNGQDIGKLKSASVPDLRRKLGLIFQHQRLLNDRSILANVMLPLMVTGASRSESEQRARAALARVGMDDRAQARPLTIRRRAAACGDCPRHCQPATNYSGRRAYCQPGSGRRRQGARSLARF